ncbi:MAG TPA: hypothetical protein VMO76_03625, partial [Candidatus Udaeobacter sp.]|nr:hypothetical protein [Candidatus Udaeobacter sp.]
KTEKHWWDTFKPYVEIFGVILLGVYTGFTIAMYCANRDAANAATKAADVADKTLKASIKSSWLDQRAWVTLVAAQTPKITLNQPIILSLRIENTGKTPAEKLSGYIVCEIFANGSEVKFLTFRQTVREELQMGPLNPNSHRTLPPIQTLNQQSSKAEIATPQMAKALADGSAFVMLHGKLTYVDAWKVNHWINFCDVPLGKTPPNFTKCTEYGEIDHNEPKL